MPEHDIARWHGHDESVMRRTYSHSRAGLAAIGDTLSRVLTAEG